MNSYLKTAVFAALGKASAEFSDWEIGFHIVEAQRKIAALLPPDVVPEIIRWGTLPNYVSGLSQYGLTNHPSANCYTAQGMQTLAILVDPVTISVNHTVPQRQLAREVLPEEYFHIIADLGNATADNVWCQVGSFILTNFRPGTGSNGMLIAKYKLSPESVSGQSLFGSYTARMVNANMSWDSAGGNHSLLRLVSGTWASLSGSIVSSEFENGTIIQSVGTAPYYNSAIPVARIIRIWDDAGVGWLEARGPGRVTSNEYVFNEWTDTSAVLLSAPPTSYEDAIENQYLANKWNLPIMSAALSNLWMKIGDKERSALYAKSYVEEMQQLGVATRGS